VDGKLNQAGGPQVNEASLLGSADWGWIVVLLWIIRELGTVANSYWAHRLELERLRREK
jgi:hypothetical protein